MSRKLSVWLKAGHTVEVIRRSARAFSERTGVEVEVKTVPEGTAHRALVNGEARPDVVTVPYWYLTELVERGALRPLDALMSAEGLQWENYVPVALEALTRSEQRWAVPHTFTGGMLSYRRDLFEASGLETPRTLDDVLRAADALPTLPIKPYGLVGRASSEFSSLETYSGWAWGHGVRLLPEDGDPTLVALEQGVADLVEALRRRGPQDLTTRDYARVGELVAKGEAGQLFDTSAWGFFLENPQQSAVAGRMGYSTISGRVRPAQFLYAEGLGVTSWSRLPSEAAAFVAWRQSEALLRSEIEEVGRFDLPRLDLPGYDWFETAVAAKSLQSYLSAVRQSWAEADPAHLTRRGDFVRAARRLMQVLSGVVSGRYENLAQGMTAVYPPTVLER